MKRTWKIALLILMLALAVASLTACGNTKLDVAEGVYVTFDGADGNGRAEICYSETDEGDMTPVFLYKLLEKKKVSANDWETLLTIGRAVTYDLEPSHGLSNGDTVTVTIDVNEPMLKSLHMTAKSQELTFKVSGLTEVKKVQPFQNFEISFSGISPDVSVDYTKSEEIDGAKVYYEMEEYGPYRDGQEITFKASISDNEYYALKEDTKTFTVSGVDKYLDNGSELLPETMAAMRAKADELVQTRFKAGEPTDYYQFSNPQYVGYVYASMEDYSYIGYQNECFLLYTVDVVENGEPYTSTYYIFFHDIIQKADGTQEVDTEKYQRPFEHEDYFLRNYQTLDSRCEELAKYWCAECNIEKFY